MTCRNLALASAFAVGLVFSTPVWAESDSARSVSAQEFIETVLADHPAIRSAEAEVRAARARARGQAQPLYNPEIEFGYEDGLDETKEVGLSQTIDLYGKREARASVANAEVAATEMRLAITRKALIADLLVAVSNFRAKDAVLQVSQSRVDLNREFLALAEKRSRAGDLPKAELLTAKLAFAEAMAEASAARLDFAEAIESLVAVTGNLLPPASLLQGAPPLPPDKIEEGIVDALPELQLARAETDTARARIHVAKRNRVPDPTLGLSVGEQSAIAPNGMRESTTLFGVRLSIPIPIRNTYRAEVDAAGADLIASEQSYSDLRRKVDARLRARLRRYQAAFDAWRDWQEQGAEPLEEQRSLLQKLWNAGEINAVDYIIQLNQTFATESAEIVLRNRLWTTWFEWLDASASISEWLENSQ